MSKGKKDSNYVAKLERAIKARWGEDAIVNPKSSWDKDKEKEYLEQAREASKKDVTHSDQSEKVEMNGFLVTKKLLNKETNRTCPVCETYSFKSEDDLYMLKFECCFDCYVEHVEGREERWATGWRPKTEK